MYVDEGVSFVMADIPASSRARRTVRASATTSCATSTAAACSFHVVDVSGSEGRDPVADFDAINAELAQYSPELATRPQIVVANKTDIMEDEALLEKLRAHVEEAGYPLFALSAASHTGTRELVLKIAEKLSTLRRSRSTSRSTSRARRSSTPPPRSTSRWTTTPTSSKARGSSG